ncbi:hypothetical protein [Epibacterium ulvae]|uniref:hypothetical protein n=1 Tax=Epibacterium ulvae TaxID=1156985 RepID=UPI00249339C8|nr:hypothetical protein [Epibacterium ulvae]
MKRLFSAKPHRGFIALVLASAVAISGFSAAPARADNDVAKFIAGAALLGIIGAAIHEHKDDKREKRRQTVQHPHKTYTPKPVPSRVSRYDLPVKCQRHFHGKSSVISRGCLTRHHTRVQSLPHRCGLSYWNGKRYRQGFGTHCLRKHGYRLVHR